MLDVFVRQWSAGVGDRRRWALPPGSVERTPRLVDDGVEEDRSWLAMDWCCRTVVPAWLRATGLGEAAEIVGSLAPVLDSEAAAAAAGVLGSVTDRARWHREATWVLRDDAVEFPAWAAVVMAGAAWHVAMESGLRPLEPGERAGAAAWAGVAAWTLGGSLKRYRGGITNHPALVSTALAVRESALDLLDRMIAAGGE